MLYVLVGLLALVAVPGATLAAAVLAAKVTARRLGVPDFRLGMPSTPETRWKHWGVRAASVAGAYLACFLLAFVAARMAGTWQPTMTVNVHEGPAREAGVKDGDRIVAIDGKPCPTFEALRTELRAGSGQRALTLERSGERISVVVTPTAQGRIGVEERLERLPSTVGESSARAFRTTLVPFSYLSNVFSLATTSNDATLSGPVGIVRATKGTQSESGFRLQLAALIASFVWPVLFVVLVLDAFLSRRRPKHGG